MRLAAFIFWILFCLRVVHACPQGTAGPGCCPPNYAGVPCAPCPLGMVDVRNRTACAYAPGIALCPPDTYCA